MAQDNPVAWYLGVDPPRDPTVLRSDADAAARIMASGAMPAAAVLD